MDTAVTNLTFQLHCNSHLAVIGSFMTLNYLKLQNKIDVAVECISVVPVELYESIAMMKWIISTTCYS